MLNAFATRSRLRGLPETLSMSKVVVVERATREESYTSKAVFELDTCQKMLFQ